MCADEPGERVVADLAPCKAKYERIKNGSASDRRLSEQETEPECASRHHAARSKFAFPCSTFCGRRLPLRWLSTCAPCISMLRPVLMPQNFIASLPSRPRSYHFSFSVIREGVAHHFSVYDALEVGKAVVLSELLTNLAIFAAVRHGRNSKINTDHPRADPDGRLDHVSRCNSFMARRAGRGRHAIQTSSRTYYRDRMYATLIALCAHDARLLGAEI